MVDGIGPDLTIRQISAGMGISLSTLTGCLEIINDSPASSVTLVPQIVLLLENHWWLMELVQT